MDLSKLVNLRLKRCTRDKVSESIPVVYSIMILTDDTSSEEIVSGVLHSPRVCQLRHPMSRNLFPIENDVMKMERCCIFVTHL